MCARFTEHNSHADDIISFAFLPNIIITDPFLTTVKLGQQYPLLVFEEHPNMSNTHWLTDVPIKVSGWG